MKKHEILDVGGFSYRLEAKLGQGGAAEVWSARSSADDQTYALKVIAKDPKSTKRNERFRNEINYGLTMSHSNVVKIHARSEDASFFYYVMDLYSMTLRGVIDAEFDYEVLFDYALQLCDGLAHVHREGVVHRDINPGYSAV